MNSKIIFFNLLICSLMMFFNIGCEFKNSYVIPEDCNKDSTENPLIEMVLIPAGTFMMGAVSGNESYEDELPVHTVNITKSFYMGKYEVTQHFWELAMGNNPSTWVGDNLPVHQINHYEAIEFCNKLSLLNGYNQCYNGTGTNIVCDFNANGYRLPTEAEWEYACRAGTYGDYYTGSGSGAREQAGWFGSNSSGRIQPVGTKIPNSFGLYDMLGNVWEHCWDWWEIDYYQNSPLNDPRGPSVPTNKSVQRGASYTNYLPYGTASDRMNIDPNLKNIDFGMRVVRSKTK